MPDKLLPCPHCGKKPTVYHGCSKGKLGDCVECAECDLENNDEVWAYVPWSDAVARWNGYVTKIQARLNAR